MGQTESDEPFVGEQFRPELSIQDFEWTDVDSLHYAVTRALVESLDVDEEAFVLQDSVDVDALARLVGADPDSTAPAHVRVSFRLENHDCTVTVDSSQGTIRVQKSDLGLY